MRYLAFLLHCTVECSFGEGVECSFSKDDPECCVGEGKDAFGEIERTEKDSTGGEEAGWLAGGEEEAGWLAGRLEETAWQAGWLAGGEEAGGSDICAW